MYFKIVELIIFYFQTSGRDVMAGGIFVCETIAIEYLVTIKLYY